MPEYQGSKSRIILREGLLILLVVFIFWLIFKRVPISQVLSAIKQVEPIRFFSLNLLFILLTLLIDAYTHFVLFKKFQYGLSLKQVLQLRTANLLFTSLGFIYGQGGMTWLISRASKRSLQETLGLLVFLFFHTYYSAIFLVTLGMIFFLPKLGKEQSFKWLWIWIIMSFCLFILWLWFFKSRFKFILPSRIRQSIFYGFIHSPPSLSFELIALRSIQFIITALLVWLAMPAMKLEIPLKALLSLIPIQGIIIAFPTPGRYGTNETAFLLLFREWATASGLVAFSLLWGTSSNILRAIISLISIQQFKKSLSQE